MSQPASVVVFDVNETLSDMAAMAGRFSDIGAPEHLAQVWFASVLRDGFALTAAGAQERFSVIGEHNLRVILVHIELELDLDAAVEHVMAGFLDLPVHPDVPEGVRALRASGRRLITLSNGATRVADALLARAGVRAEFAVLLSVEDADGWKPARSPYEYAAQMCGTELSEMVMVAVHPWDIDGAARAGMQTAWIDRQGAAYPSYAMPPTHTVRSLGELADKLS